MADEIPSGAQESEAPKSSETKKPSKENRMGVEWPPEKTTDTPLEPLQEAKIDDADTKKQKLVDFLDKIVRKAKKQAKETPDDPSVFLKMFAGVLNRIESKANESTAKKNVNQILVELLHQIDEGKTLKDTLKEIRGDRDLMNLEGADEIVKTLEKDPEKTQGLVAQIRVEIEKLEAAEAEKKVTEKTDTTTTPSLETDSDETAVELSEIKPNPKSSEISVSDQRSDPISKLTAQVTGKMAKSTFSITGPESLATSSTQPSVTPTAETPASTASGPSATPRK